MYPARHRNPFVPILVIGVLFLCIHGTARAENPRYGGVLTFGVEDAFRGFDALTASMLTICDSIVNSTIQERLFDLDDQGNLVPLLALSATPSPDGKTWTITLRQGVSFHDGTPFTADAVVHHWSRLLTPDNKFRGRSQVAPIRAVEKIDDFTVRFVLAHAWLPFPGILADTRTLITHIPAPQAVDSGTQMRAPVGTGPFMFKEWKAGDRLVVTKNPNYWRKVEPYLDKIVFKPAPDHQTRFASLQSGQMDMIFMDRGHILEKADKDDSLAHYQGDANGAEIFLLNTTQPPLSDPRVRRAIAHAWDQSTYIHMSYKDSIPTAHHPFGNEISCGETGYRQPNLEKSKQLVAEYGQPIEIECLHTKTKRGREFGLMLQQFCKEAGLTVTPQGMNVGPIVKKVFSKDYHVSSWRIPAMVDLGPYLFRSFHSQSRGNFSGYANPQMDRLLEAQRTETNPDKRQRLFCAIATLLNDDAPILYRGGRRYHILAKKEIAGLPEIRNGVIRVAGAWFRK